VGPLARCAAWVWSLRGNTMRTGKLVLAAVAAAGLSGAVFAQSPVLHFNYSTAGGAYVREVSGTVQDPQGMLNALAPLQPPAGAHGAYGLIGDDSLLGQQGGYGLRQLGAVARRYITFDTFRVVQPTGFANIGVQSGTFSSAVQLNDTTLGWVFFDLRAQFEAGLKSVVATPPPSSGAKVLDVYFTAWSYTLTAEAKDVVQVAAAAYRSLGANRIELVGHADTAESDDAQLLNSARYEATECAAMSPQSRLADPLCSWKHADAMKLAMLRAQAVASELVEEGVPQSALHVSSAGADDPAVQTPPGTTEPLDRQVEIDVP